MDHEIQFKEKQQFTQWWVWAILIGVNSIFIYGVFKQVVGGSQFGDKPISNLGLLIVTGIIILFTFLFFNFRLDTKINREGIYVRFFPFHLSFQHYSWEKIKKSYVRKYNPVFEYGGWGFRFGLLGKGRAFNMSGNYGLQLKFVDNKELLIGTNKPDELKKTLVRMGRLVE